MFSIELYKSNVSLKFGKCVTRTGGGGAVRPTASPDRNTQNTVHSQHKQAALACCHGNTTLLHFDSLKNTPMCASFLQQFKRVYSVYLLTIWCSEEERSPHSINSACVSHVMNEQRHEITLWSIKVLNTLSASQCKLLSAFQTVNERSVIWDTGVSPSVTMCREKTSRLQIGG